MTGLRLRTVGSIAIDDDQRIQAYEEKQETNLDPQEAREPQALYQGESALGVSSDVQRSALTKILDLDQRMSEVLKDSK